MGGCISLSSSTRRPQNLSFSPPQGCPNINRPGRPRVSPVQKERDEDYGGMRNGIEISDRNGAGSAVMESAAMERSRIRNLAEQAHELE